MFRSFLFVPGDRPERHAKAAASSADAVCIDLEDAVSPANKSKAREAAIASVGVTRTADVAIGVRVNAFDAIEGYRDIAAIGEAGIDPDFVLLPKVRSGDPVRAVRSALGDIPVWALMETAEALRNVHDLCEAVGPQGGIVFGGADLSAALGCDLSWEALYFARASLVAAAAAFGCQTLDVPYLNVRDIDGLIVETARSKALGLTGRSCIHPDQVGPINAVYTPHADDIAGAKAIIAAYEANDGRVLLHEGRLVEKPVLAAARRLLARARD